MSNLAGWAANSGDSDEPVALPDAVLETFTQGVKNPACAGGAVADLLAQRGEHIYADLLFSLASLRYPPAEARSLWDQLLAHEAEMETRLGRRVGLRVAALDFFVNIRGELASPRVVDPRVIERLREHARTDPLTGLGNRRLYKEKLAEELVRAERYRAPFVIAIFDIDDFKRVNDVHGHAVGDQVLQRVSDAIRATMRKSDVAARWGGEEFIVLMPHSLKKGGSILAERIRARVERDLGDLEVTVSGGVAGYPTDGATESALFEFADRALYRAKSEGKNRIRVAPFERRAFPRLEDQLPVRLVVVDDEEHAIDASTSNVSSGGIAIRHPAPLPIPTRVRGRIAVGGRQAEFIGRVVYVEEIARDRYDVGIQFLEIAVESKSLLLSHSE